MVSLEKLRNMDVGGIRGLIANPATSAQVQVHFLTSPERTNVYVAQMEAKPAASNGENDNRSGTETETNTNGS